MSTDRGKTPKRPVVIPGAKQVRSTPKRPGWGIMAESGDPAKRKTTGNRVPNSKAKSTANKGDMSGASGR